MTPTHEEIETLERLAKAAKPWTEESHADCVHFSPDPDGPDTYRAGPHEFKCKDYVRGIGLIPTEAIDTGDFIAYANPDRILRLCARIRELETALKKYANQEDWGYDHGSNSDCDYGHAAREALGE